jgi:hypothetical protein
LITRVGCGDATAELLPSDGRSKTGDGAVVRTGTLVPVKADLRAAFIRSYSGRGLSDERDGDSLPALPRA